MNLPFSLILDILVALLLAVTIAYAVILNRKLGMLRHDRSELERLALSFGESTRRAEESIGRLKASAAELQGQIEKARSLHDDIVFLMERGTSTADRLEEAVRTARKETTPAAGAPSAKSMTTLETAVQAAAQEAGVPKAPRTTNQPATTQPAPTKQAGSGGFPEPRSEAERELLKALEAAR